MEKENWIGMKVKLIFQDSSRVLIKIGTIRKVDQFFVEIETSSNTEIIPKERVLRMEVLQ